MSVLISSKFRNGPVVLVSRKIDYIFPLSYGYLAGYLREMGEDVRVVFRPALSEFAAFVKQIMDMHPVLVGFGNLYPELPEISKLIQMLDDAGRAFPVVIGGQMVSPIPRFAVEITRADFGVIGEAEITLQRLVTVLREGGDPGSVKGLVVRSKDDFTFTGPGEFIEDLSKLPPIPYDLFPQNEWLSIGRWYARYSPQPHWRFADRVINVHAGRGCPFECNFCYHHSKPRFRPMELVMAEAGDDLERFNGNMLYFSDETTLYSPQRVRQMLRGLKALPPRRLEYSVSSRFDILDKIDDNLLMEMRETGCRIMGLGIESGSDRILEIIGKGFSRDTVLRGLERLKKAGILPTVSIMVGQFTETIEDVEASIALMRESVRSNRNIQYTFTITTPFPGSKLYSLIFQKGYLRDDKEFYDLFFRSKGGLRYVVNLSQMKDEELIAMYHKINQVYRQEQSRVIKPSVKKIEFLMGKVAAVQERLERKIFAQFSAKVKGLRILQRLQQWLYEFVQIRLDNLRLRLRGI